MVICLERGADLHVAQLMPVPLTVSCFSKIQIDFTFLVPAGLGSPGKWSLNGCVCMRACYLFTDLRGLRCRRFSVQQADEPDAVHAGARLRSLHARRPYRRGVSAAVRHQPRQGADILAHPATVQGSHGQYSHESIGNQGHRER